MLLLSPKPTSTEPPVVPSTKTRNRTGICNIFKAAMPSGEKVTLEQAIAILRAGW